MVELYIRAGEFVIRKNGQEMVLSLEEAEELLHHLGPALAWDSFQRKM